MEAEGPEEIRLFEAVDHAADGVAHAAGSQQDNGAGGNPGEGAEVKED